MNMMEPNAENFKLINQAIANIDKKYGKNSVFILDSNERLQNVEVVSTGSIVLDKALGVGGLPRGRVIEILGNPGGGKTTLALQVVSEAQKLGLICAYIDVENAIDIKYSKSIGVQTDKLLFSQPECVSESSMILTSNGYKKVNELNDYDKILSFNGNDFIQNNFQLIDSLCKKCYKVITSCGVSIVSLDHKFKKFDGYFKLSDLKEGDYIEAPLKINLFNKTRNDLDKEDSIMLGMLIADGNYNGSSIRFFKKDSGILKWINDYITNKYSKVSFLKRKNSELTYSFSKKQRSNKDNIFSKFVHKYLGYVCNNNKYIPKEIFECGDDALAGIVCGLWSCDGSITKSGIMEYSTISENVAFGVMNILTHFGIKFNYYLKKDNRKSTYKNLHRIYINDYNGLCDFKSKIGLIGRLNITNNMISNKESIIKYPKEVWDVIFCEIYKKYKTIKDFSNIFHDNTKYVDRHIFNTKRGVSIEFLEKINSILESKVINDLISKPVYYVKINHIIEDKIQKTYDLSIENTHNFICNNHIVHNCGEAALEIAESLIETNQVGVLVIDSVAALVPKAELEGEMEDNTIALQARLMSKALRKLTNVVSKSGCICIFINQLRDLIGVSWGKKSDSPGGKSLKFYSSVRIEIDRIGSIKNGSEIIGNRVRAKVIKNKVAAPFKEAEFDLIFGHGIDKISEIIDLAVERKIIDKSGTWYSYKGDRLGQGKEQVKTFLLINPDIVKEIESQIYTTEPVVIKPSDDIEIGDLEIG